jgi:hypothetical protein
VVRTGAEEGVWQEVQGLSLVALFQYLVAQSVADEVPGLADSLFEGGGVVPAEVVEAGYVQELAWGSVGLGGVEDKIPFEIKDFGYDFG